MRPPTPPQLRAVVVRLRLEGRTYAEIADVTGLGVATVNRILRLQRETGSTEPKSPGGGNFSPLRGRVEKKIKQLVDALPDSTIAKLTAALERAERLATSTSSVQRALKRMGYSRKKSAS